MRNMEVYILRSTGSLCPWTSEGWEQVDLRVEVETECCEVSSQRQTHQVGIRLRGSDEGQQADHSKLVHHHVGWDVGHLAYKDKKVKTISLGDNFLVP